MPEPSPRNNLTLRKAAAIALVIVGIIALALLFWQLASILLLAFGGILIAIFLRTLSGWVSKFTRLPDTASLIIVLLILLALTAGLVYFSGDSIAGQMTKLADEIPRSIENVRDYLNRYEWGKWIISKIPSSAEELPISGKDVTSVASGALSSLTGLLAAGLVVFFVAMFLSFDPKTYLRGAIRLVPVRKRERIMTVLAEVHDTLQMWLLGTILAMILVGVSTGVGLALLGVPLALALGVIAAVLTFIPNFGPVLAAIPAILLAFLESPIMALYVIILYVAVQMVETYLITPLIQQKTISLPPALTLSAQVGLGILFGLPGVILATPLTAGALVLVHRLYVEDVLESSASESKAASPDSGSYGQVH